MRRHTLIVVGVVAAGVLAVPTPAHATSADVVVSQVYGGGGNTGAQYANDFVELYNRGAAAVDVTGWTVQYASAGGSTWSRTTLSGNVAAGRYYLVGEGAGAGSGAPLPTPDATGAIAMSATAGKVALVTNGTALTCSTGCATQPGVHDFVGYGTTASSAEGSPTPNLCNDMHDCSVSTGDTWLKNNLGAYATWAKTHNSLLLVTFDEDDHSANNRIPTLFYGAHVATGSYAEHITHYTVLRTLESLNGLGCTGNSCSVSPISDIWN